MGSKLSMLATNYNDDDRNPSCKKQYPMLLESLRPDCCKPNGRSKVAMSKKRQLDLSEQQDVRIFASNSKERSLTLGEWLLSTPGSKPDSFKDGELCVLKNIPPRSPTSARRTRRTRSQSAKNINQKKVGDDHESFSLEMLVILDRVRDLEEEEQLYSSAGVSSIVRRGRSGKTTTAKRVRFRSPEGLADVMEFSSPAVE